MMICIISLQFGKDKNRCIEILTLETDRIKRGPYGRYTDQRKYSLQGTNTSFSVKSSLTSLPTSLATSDSVSTFQSYDESESPRRSLTLPVHLNLPPRRSQFVARKTSPTNNYMTSNNEVVASNNQTSDYATSTHSNDSIPMLVLTPDSPVDFFRCDEDYIDFFVFGNANSVTATCLDIDLSANADEDEDNEDVCSLRTTTVSRGVINFMSGGSPLSSTDFTTIRQVLIRQKLSSLSIKTSSALFSVRFLF